MSGDVLGGKAARALRQRVAISLLFILSERPLRMRVQKCPIASQGKHQKCFCIQPR